MDVPRIILQQLGGQRFLAMTGANHLVGDKNKLRMTLTKNHSKANRLEITLTADDLYTMRFYRYVAPKLNTKSWTFTPEKVTEIALFDGLFFDQLREIYESVTWQRTSLTEVF